MISAEEKMMFVYDLFRLSINLIVLWVLLTFIGTLVAVSFGPYWFSKISLPVSGFLGLSTFIFFGELWSLFHRINQATIFLLIAVCMVLLGWRWKIYFENTRHFQSTIKPMPCVLVLALFFIVALNALSPVLHYDDGLYHLSAIRWASEHRVVPGLANLHGRLGYNQSFFVFVALLAKLIGTEKARQIANALVVLICSQVPIGFVRPGLREQALRRSRLYALLLFPAFLYAGLHVFLSSAAPDVAVTPLALLGTFSFHNFLVFRQEHDEEEMRSWAIITSLVCVLLVKFKLSYVAFGSVILVFVWIIFSWNKKLTIRPEAVTLVWMSCILFGPWLARGYVSSGYPFYPATSFGLRVDWRVPENMARVEQEWIYSWARLPPKPPSEVLGNWNWIPDWIKRNSVYLANVRAFFLICGGLFCFLLGLLIRASPRERFLQAVLFVPSIFGLAFWFFTAPEPRFAEGLFWIVGLNGVFGFLILTQDSGPWRSLLFTCMLSAGLLSSEVCSEMPRIWLERKCYPQKTPRVALYAKVTTSGLTVFVPVPGTDQTWDARLPATPYFNPRLEMRGTTLDEGSESTSD
jgi:hypothetical protein